MTQIDFHTDLQVHRENRKPSSTGHSYAKLQMAERRIKVKQAAATRHYVCIFRRERIVVEKVVLSVHGGAAGVFFNGVQYGNRRIH